MRKIILLFFLICMIQLASAAYDITGTVYDALDGEVADGHTVVLWNPVNGIDDNLTDTIGPGGSSGVANNYTIDCQLLTTACIQGDEMRIKVLNDGDDYITDYTSLTVGAGSSGSAPNLTVNSIPNSTLILPVNYENSSDEVEFNCSASDFDGNLANITLYGNWSGGWHANETKTITGVQNKTFFIKNLSEGKYIWGCMVTDNLLISNFSDDNFTITIDRTPPTIYSVYVNETYVCGDTKVRVNCTVDDAFTDLSSIIIEAHGPLFWNNHSTQLLVGDVYYADILVNDTGNWTFNCIANDSANNRKNLTSQVLQGYSAGPDLVVYPSEINFSNYSSMENEQVVINATINNRGCGDSEGFVVGFYDGDPDSGGIQINGNQTISIFGLSNDSVSVIWDAEIGLTNVYVFADFNNSVTEENETNNKANQTIELGAWQEFYGNVSADKFLATNLTFNLTSWKNISDLQGNIFITDMEADVSWRSLQAIGRDIDNVSTSNDFSDIDVLLGMQSFNDSVYNVFTDSGTPKGTETFLVDQRYIDNVPIINSTNNTNFITGILWDTDDDDADGEFSQDDEEDLVFVAKINESSDGMYGKYNYELTIPVRLREYDPADQTDVYLYYNLV